MSSSSSDISLSTIGADSGISNLNLASIPANIRGGNSQAKKAYSEGLQFEDMLVGELTQQLANTMYGGQGSDTGSSTDGGSDSTAGSSGSGGLLSGASAYSSLIPQALTSSIMSNGGLGMAEQFAGELDPSLLTQSSGAADSSDTDVKS